MKKYYSIALALSAVLSFAQTISFENNEGFINGNIHGQGAWISTPTGGVPENVTNQIISQDHATDGNNSLKIVRESTFGIQSEPIIGGFYNLPTPLSFTNFSVTFDINMSQINGSVFGFQAVNSLEEKYVVRVDFDKAGKMKILDSVSGILGLIATSGLWSPNTWCRVKVVGTATDIRYYLNDVLIYTGNAVSAFSIDQLRFVHNNGLGIAYIDNIKINSETMMSVKETGADKKGIVLYPNPVSDFIHLNSPSKIKNVKIYDLLGKRIEAQLNDGKVDVKNLPLGEYLLNIETEKGNFTEKFIKK
ncbi:T9SS type A sorting domain-containing protein [Chryseobacterium aurantiacum]|uniref:T9SS type A sorting domain-containing protein n=1 Tax=Chryseobacterium aurantiacum TaxID=2116499 RepID=UPI000D12A8A1|nr:T9SS type A sorting domain-containing protein [Chryseobacterium aurantiacum]